MISGILSSEERAIAVGYEIRLSLWLELHGLKAGCFRPFALNKTYPATNPMFDWANVIRGGIPLLKRELLQSGGAIVPLPGWTNVIDECSKNEYPVHLITDYFYRTGIDLSIVACTGNRSTTWPPSILKCQQDVILPKAVADFSQESIAIFVHCYYPSILPDLKKYLKNIKYNADIYVSTDSESKVSEIREILSDMQFNTIDVRVVKNRGWDIGPFITEFNNVIPKYDIICKVHVKASTNQPTSFAQEWRTLLYKSLLGSEQHIKQIVEFFSNNHQMGILSPSAHPILPIELGCNCKQVLDILKKMDILLPPSEAIDFPAGTMFWARSAALQPLLDLHLSIDDFEETNPLQRDGTLAHALERCIFFSCAKAGFNYGRVAPPPYGILRVARPRDFSGSFDPLKQSPYNI